MPRPDYLTVPPALCRSALESAIDDIALAAVSSAIDDALSRVVAWSHGERSARQRREPQFGGGRLPRLRPGRAEGDEQWHDEYGQDASGVIVLVRRYADNGEISSVEVWLTESQSVVLEMRVNALAELRRVAFDDQGRVVASGVITRQLTERGRAAFVGYEAEMYSYDDAGLESVRTWSEPAGHRGPYAGFFTRPAGRQRSAGFVYRPFEAACPTEWDDSQLDVSVERLLEGLRERVVELAGGLGVSQPVFHLRLFSGRELGQGKSQFMVQISPATVADRALIERRRPYKPLDSYIKFNKGGLNAEDDDTSDWGLGDLVALGRQIELELHRRRDEARITEIWRELGRRLAAQDWTECFPVTDDFLVLVTPGDLYSRKEHVAVISEMLGEERFQALLAAETARAEELGAQPGAKPISRRSALKRLRSELDAAGEQTTFAAAWKGFLSFLAVPISGCDPLDDEDMVLIEQSGRREISLVRQLTDPSGEDMVQLRVDVTFTTDSALEGFDGGSVWAAPFEDAIRAAIEELPGLGALIAQNPAVAGIEAWADEV